MGQTQELMALQQRVEEWRRKHGGGRGSRIPKEMWNEAVNVTRTAGLYPTARALRFNYEKLKRLAASKVSPPKKQATEFVTLQMPQQQPNGLKVVIDLAGRDGDQMRIEVTGGNPVDVVSLAQAFWPRRS